MRGVGEFVATMYPDSLADVELELPAVRPGYLVPINHLPLWLLIPIWAGTYHRVKVDLLGRPPRTLANPL